MKGRIKKIFQDPNPESIPFWPQNDVWPYMFTVVITSPDQEKAKSTAEAYHEFLHDAWGHRDQQEMADVYFDASPVELM